MELLENIDIIKTNCNSEEYLENRKLLEQLNTFFENRGIKNRWIEKSCYNDNCTRVWLFVSLNFTGKLKEILQVSIFNITFE